MKFGIGQSVARTEDPRLITGAGEYTDDINRPGQLYLRVLRSPYAHGRIAELNVKPALKKKGVRAIYTAADLAHLGGLPCRASLSDADGKPAFIPHRPILAESRVLFVGQAVAAVIAETKEQAQNAVEAIEFDVEDIPACSDPGRALDPDTQPIHSEQDDNLCVHFQQVLQIVSQQLLPLLADDLSPISDPVRILRVSSTKYSVWTKHKHTDFPFLHVYLF